MTERFLTIAVEKIGPVARLPLMSMIPASGNWRSAKRGGILPSDTDRMLALLRHRGVIDSLRPRRQQRQNDYFGRF
jgi:hypothetical protein